jgi:oligopeptide transport system ATP-binding protein
MCTAEPRSPVLEVRNLKKHFPVHAGLWRREAGSIRAVDGVSFTLSRGKTLGLVGESGCGKSTTGRAVLRLIEPTSGSVHFKGEDVLRLGSARLKRLRRSLQIIFQDPFASLDPRKTVERIIGEPLHVHTRLGKKEKRELIRRALDSVGLDRGFIGRYPHQLSGGQRQRVGIARALILKPDAVICDEPLSALDVSIQAQIVNLLLDLQETLDLAFLFISHDLSVVKYVSHEIAVMYLGRFVEVAGKNDLFDRRLHPYTEMLLSSVLYPYRIERILSGEMPSGEVPSPLSPPGGCRFHPRCRYRLDLCASIEPPLRSVSDGHLVACHLYAT